jgi:hypothetical protein
VLVVSTGMEAHGPQVVGRVRAPVVAASASLPLEEPAARALGVSTPLPPPLPVRTSRAVLVLLLCSLRAGATTTREGGDRGLLGTGRAAV